MSQGCATITPTMGDPQHELSLRQRWRLARVNAGLSQGAAAKQLGVERGSIRRIEDGKTKLPPSYVLWAIALWGAPSSLLDADDLARAAGDDPIQDLEDLVQQLQVAWRSHSPREEDSASDSS